MEAWLKARGALPEPPPAELLWRAVSDEADRDHEADLGVIVERAAARAAELSGAPVRPASPEALSVGSPELRRALEGAVAADGAWNTVDMLIGRYADAAGISRTPPPIASLMGALAGEPGVKQPAGYAVLDPAAGTGELLGHGDYWCGQVSGQELDPALARLARISVPEGEIATGDSLRDDQFAGELVDVVLCHPPFGVRDWGQEELAGDPRWAYGVPPKSEPELAWVQHALSHLKPGGRAVLLLPPAVTSRPSARRIRAELVRRGVLRAVIGLPSGLVRPVHVPVHLWVFQKPAGAGPVDPRVLFVDVAGKNWSDHDRESGLSLESPLSGEVAAAALAAWRAFAGEDQHPLASSVGALPGEPGTWQVVRAIDLLDDEVDLTPARHVEPARTGRTPEQAADEIRTLHAEVRAALATVGDALPAATWTVNRVPPAWTTASLAELARRGMIEYTRGGSRVADEITVRLGDVLVPVTAAAAARASVATEADEGVPLDRGMFLIRPDTARLDPWFLAGFLTAPANIQRASTGTSALRMLNVRALTVPLPPLAEQRRYGAAFRALHDLVDATSRAGKQAAELAQLLSGALADGSLAPPGDIDARQSTSHSITGGSVDDPR